MNKINRDLLVVFNIFGEKAEEQAHVEEHISALESIFWHIEKNLKLLAKLSTSNMEIFTTTF